MMPKAMFSMISGVLVADDRLGGAAGLTESSRRSRRTRSTRRRTRPIWRRMRRRSWEALHCGGVRGHGARVPEAFVRVHGSDPNIACAMRSVNYPPETVKNALRDGLPHRCGIRARQWLLMRCGLSSMGAQPRSTPAPTEPTGSAAGAPAEAPPVSLGRPPLRSCRLNDSQ